MKIKNNIRKTNQNKSKQIKIKNILICSDILMTKEKEQSSNRQWLFDILEMPIKQSTGIQIRTFFSSLTQTNLLSRKIFFEKSGIKLNIDMTQFYFDINQIKDESLAYLNQFINENDLIIGYELSDQTKAILNKLNIAFVDIWLHPIRYLDDILFGFQSNIPEIQAKLFEYNLNEEIYQIYASRLKVQAYKGWNRKPIQLPPNSALFIGQMLNDKSVNLNGHFLSIMDFQEQFEQMVVQHECVFYSRHPYLKSGDEHILKYLKRFPNVTLTDLPVYEMLANKNIKTVMSVSSSVLEEAKYFHKKVIRLHRPVIKLSSQYQQDSHASIYQSFVYGHFWSNVLSPVMMTYPCANISFLDEKDKLRDMLGFYWSHSKIDKVEEMRQNLLLISKKVSNFCLDNTKPQPNLPNKAIVSNPISLNNDHQSFDTSSQELLKKYILNKDVVSFDIFDTLLERNISSPNIIFELMSEEADKIAGNKFQGQFAQIRSQIRKTSDTKYFFNEEILLDKRYESLAKQYKLSKEQTQKLLNLELDWERKLSIPKSIGMQMYQFAKQHNKKVILVSDIYFDTDFVCELLLKAGYKDWDNLYLSSEKGVLKDSGKLFDIVLKELAINPKKIIHIGDNKHSDIKQAEEKGIDTFYISTKSRAFKNTPLQQAIQNISHSLSRNIIEGIISTQYTRHIQENSFSFLQKQPYNFGYSILGLMFFNFAKWILDNAKKDGIKQLYFLARDGDIVKKCYDIIAAQTPDNPQSHYIYASRRSIQVANIHSNEDILSILETNFTPIELGKLLEFRFGIKAAQLDNTIFQKYGFNNENSLADWKLNKQNIQNFFTDKIVSDLIMTNALNEREVLCSYYAEQGLTSEISKVAFVDIGHLGSLQAGLEKLLSLPSSVGYYFASFEGIDENIKKPSQSRGYVIDKVHPKSGHFYFNHILMYEFSFINDQDSFVCMRKNNQGFTPIFLSIGEQDDARKHFARLTHQAIVDFTQTICNLYGKNLSILQISAEQSCILYESMLAQPIRDDVLIFKNLCFENVYSGRPSQWVTPDFSDSEITRPFFWKELKEPEFRIIYTDTSSNPPDMSKRMAYYSVKLMTYFMFKRYRAKFNRNPEEFCADSNFAWVRKIGRYLYMS